MRRTLELVAVLSIIASANAMLTNAMLTKNDAAHPDRQTNYPSFVTRLNW